MADVRVTVVASASLVNGNDVVTLDATVDNPNSETLTYRWIAFPSVGVFANDQAVDTTWTAPIQDHEQVVTLALTAFYGTQATGTPFRFGFSGLGSTHVLGGNGAVGTAGVTIRASTVAESQTLAAYASVDRPTLTQHQFLTGQTLSADADVGQSTVAQRQILSDQRLVAAAAILSAPTVTQTIPSAVLIAQTLAASATLSALTVVAPDPFAVMSAQTLSATARLVIPTVSVQDAGAHVLIAQTLAVAATLPTPTAVIQNPSAVSLSAQTLAAVATIPQPTLVAQAPTAAILISQAVAARATVSEATLRQTLSVGAQTLAAAATVSQPTLVAQGPNAAVLSAQTVSASTALAQPAKVLTLDDFDDGAQLVDALALLTANLSQATRLYIAPERGGTDAPIDGELGIGGPLQTLITRISWNGTDINLNDSDVPVALTLRDWFGEPSSISPWTLTIQTDEGTASTNQLGGTGGGFANFRFAGHPNIGIINNITAGRRFLMGLTRAVLATQTINASATLNSPTAVTQDIGDVTLSAQTVGAAASLGQPILSRRFPAQTVEAVARISQPALSQQTPTATPDPQTLEATAVLTAPMLQSVTPTAQADAQAVAAFAQLSQPALDQMMPTGNIQGRTVAATAIISAPTLAQQAPSAVALDAQTLTAATTLPTPTLMQQPIGTITLAGQTVEAVASLQAPTAIAIPPGDVEADGQTVSASAQLSQPTLTQTVPTATLGAQTLAATALISENTLRHIPLPVALAGQTVEAVATLSRPSVATSSAGTVAATSQTLTATATLSRPALDQIVPPALPQSQTLAATAQIAVPALRQIPPGVGATGQTLAAAAEVRQPTLRQVPPPDVLTGQTVAAAASLSRPALAAVGSIDTVATAQTIGAAATLSQPTLTQQGANAVVLSAQTLAASASLRQPSIQQGTITAVVLSAQTLAAIAVLPQPTGTTGAATAARLRVQPIRAFIFMHAPALDRPPNLALAIPAGAATPMVHLGWTAPDTLISGNAITELNGLYSMGALDSETTRITGPEPEFIITYTDSSNTEWIILSMLDVRYEYRVIADGQSGAFTLGSIPKPDGDIQYSLATESGLLTADMNGLAFDISAIGDASAGTLTLYAEPDPAHIQRIRFRSATADYDWYGDIPFLRLDANPRIPQVGGWPRITTGKDGLRSLHPFRVPDAEVQLRITTDEYIARPWQADQPVAVVEAYADAKANTTTYLSQIVGRIERPDYRETFIGRYVDLDIIGNTGALLRVNVDTVHYAAINMDDAVVAILDEAGWPSAFRDLQITSLSAVPLTHWYLNNDDALRSVLDLLDTAGPPAQAYENRKGQLSLLGIDWVVNLTRPAINLGPAVGIDVYTEQSASVDVESQINAATAEVSSWTATTIVNNIWHTTDITVESGRSLTLIANFRNVVTSIEPLLDGTDYTNTGTGSATVTLQNARATEAEIVIEASGGTVVFDRIQLRGLILTDEQRRRVTARNTTSIADLGTEKFWPGAIVPQINAVNAQALLNRLVGAYSDAISSATLRVRLEDNYAVASQLQHLVQVNAPDRDGQTYAGFVRQTRKEYTPEGSWLTLTLEQDAGVLSPDVGPFRFSRSAFGSSSYLWV